MKTSPLKSADRNVMKPGIYIASINEDITTYDIRMKEPNKEPVLTNSALHTMEHIINDYLSKTEFADNIIHFAPMASRTGFFLVTRNLSDKYCVELIKNAFTYVEEFWGKIPNATVNACSSCLEHNLPQAKEEAKHFSKIIADLTKNDLEYPVEQIEE